MAEKTLTRQDLEQTFRGFANIGLRKQLLRRAIITDPSNPGKTVFNGTR